MNMKICLYTAIFGGYETLKSPVRIDGLDYVCFTDNESMRSDIWDIRHISITNDSPPPLFYKRIKCLSHQVLPEYDYTIWLDANFQLEDKNYLSFLFDQLHSDKLLLYEHFCHPQNLVGDPRNCLYEEIRHSRQILKYAHEDLAKQSVEYHNAGYPTNNGLYQSGFLLRNNTDPEVAEFNQAWLKEIEKFGKSCPQCQVSLPFVLWKQGINFDAVSNENIWNTDRYYITNHGDDNALGE